MPFATSASQIDLPSTLTDGARRYASSLPTGTAILTSISSAVAACKNSLQIPNALCDSTRTGIRPSRWPQALAISANSASTSSGRPSAVYKSVKSAAGISPICAPWQITRPEAIAMLGNNFCASVTPSLSFAMGIASVLRARGAGVSLSVRSHISPNVP